MKNKKKAFTLTELLVVVIVIGVLSAAVLPKFSKVIETRKTTEAEELMASIRTEQEKRCALDKPYLTQMSELTDVVKTASTKNYQINLQDKGIKAASKGKYSYTLQMPSYADGRICCDGDDCEKLNKNYPSCTGFSYEPSPDSCAGTITEPSTPTPCEIDPTSCECNPNQAKCCAAGEVWQDGQCVQEEPVPSGCSDEHTEGELALKLIGSGDKLVLNKCSLTECATTSYHWHCGADTEYEWEKTEETNCEPKPSDTKPCENAGNKIASGNMTATYTCTSSGWSQSGWDRSACRYICDASTKPQEDPNKTMQCNYCGKAVIGYECDDTTGTGSSVSNRECACPSAFWSGRYCDGRCRWVTERCSTSSSGGGGGGGGMRGGCTTSLEVVGYYRDASGQYHESYAEVTTCDGEM